MVLKVAERKGIRGLILDLHLVAIERRCDPDTQEIIIKGTISQVGWSKASGKNVDPGKDCPHHTPINAKQNNPFRTVDMPTTWA